MSESMTHEQVVAAMKELEPQLDKFARLLVVTGAALKPGQELVVNAPVEGAAFVRRVVAAAYAEGAGHVTVIWNDEVISRLDYENVALEWFQHTPAWKKEQLNGLAEAGESPANICRYVLASIIGAVERATLQALEKYPGLPVLCAGGVASNKLLRETMTRSCGAVFAQPRFSTDNAMGVAILTWRAMYQKETT